MAITREALYKEVWSEPMTTVARRYDVSSNYLARICAMLNVPHPPRGYWAKHAVNTAPQKPPLPPATGAHASRWERGALPDAPQSPVGTELPAPGPKRRKWARPAVHPLVDNVDALFKATYVSSISESNYLRPRKRALADVTTSEEHLSDALHLASEFYLALEDRGYKVTMASGGHLGRRPEVDHREIPPKPIAGGYDHAAHDRWSPSRLTVTAIGALAVGLSVYELSTKVSGRHYNGQWTPLSEIPANSRSSRLSDYVYERDRSSGRFCIRAYSPYSVASWQQEWRETAPGQLLKRLKGICVEIEAAAPRLLELIAEGERKAEEERIRWLRQREEEAKREEARRRIEAAEASRKSLLEAIDAWGVTMRLQAFFEDVDRRIAEMPVEEREQMFARLKEARAIVGSTNALEKFRAWKNPAEVFKQLGESSRRWW